MLKIYSMIRLGIAKCKIFHVVCGVCFKDCREYQQLKMSEIYSQLITNFIKLIVKFLPEEGKACFDLMED